MRVYPTWAYAHNYGDFFKRLNNDPIARKVHSCAAKGLFTVEQCSPESVGIGKDDFSFEKETIYDKTLKDGILKP